MQAFRVVNYNINALSKANKTTLRGDDYEEQGSNDDETQGRSYPAACFPLQQKAQIQNAPLHTSELIQHGT